jgi:D-alanyl-D-alanine carboxypeptidase (penicillin-binding protein 5/6)
VWLGNQAQPFLTTVPGALAAKTGFTDAASHTFLCAASRHGRRLGVIFLRAQRYPIDQWQQAARLLDWGYALGRGTAVGHLDPAARPPSTALPATASSLATQSVSAAAAAHHKSDPPWPLIGVAIALAAGGVLWLAGRWLIRPRTGGAGAR